MDIRDEIRRLVQADSTASFAIDDKEFHRLAPLQQHSEKINSSKDPLYLSKFLKSYTTWGHNLYIISKGNFNEIKKVGSQNKNTYEVKLLSFFKTGRNTKNITIFHYLPPKKLAPTILPENESHNRIQNGSFEIPETQSNTRKQFQKWIERGASFYCLNSIVLPRSNNRLLPTNWDINTDQSYPIIFLDKNNPIEGQYSLHVFFNHLDSYFPLWLLNKFESESGTLSLKIKSLTGNTVLKLTRVDFEKDGKWFNAPQEYNIYLSDTATHDISVHVNQDEFLASLAFYRLLIKDANILIDSVQFIPDEVNTF